MGVGEQLAVEPAHVADAGGNLQRFVEGDRPVLGVVLIVEPEFGVLDRPERCKPAGVGVDLAGEGLDLGAPVRPGIESGHVLAGDGDLAVVHSHPNGLWGKKLQLSPSATPHVSLSPLLPS
ncbi:MAG: hypothetical protein J07HN6_00307 [Halonotius sp. J07HN6]|nr:MAG: hypothetical protein J07HN6_00307 [Halonotius sp. J07HN6]